MNLFAWLQSLFQPKKKSTEITQLPVSAKSVPPAATAAPVFNPLKDIPSLSQLASDLIDAGLKYVGVREHGYNKGPEVELFQRFVDGKAQGESWCMAFVQFIVGQVCAKYGIKTPLYPSEHCNTVYSKTAAKYLEQAWGVGFAFIMRNPADNSGHTGICAPGNMAVEGNTSVAGSTDGDGVYYRLRSPKGSATKPMRGYINLPLMIQDAIKEARQKVAA